MLYQFPQAMAQDYWRQTGVQPMSGGQRNPFGAPRLQNGFQGATPNAFANPAALFGPRKKKSQLGLSAAMPNMGGI